MGPVLSRCLIVVLLVSIARAHDTWVQTNTAVVGAGDVIHADLMLSNHGNHHRDFKLAGKVAAGGFTLGVIGPDGEHTDLTTAAVDLGAEPKQGYWSVAYTPTRPGLHIMTQTSDRVVSYAPKRSVKSAKALFVASQGRNNSGNEHPGFDRVLGHPLELVPQTERRLRRVRPDK